MEERTVVFRFEYPYIDEDWPHPNMSDEDLVEDATETLFQFLLEGGDVSANATVIHEEIKYVH